MPTRTENSDRVLPNSRRWRLNGSGQLVDTEADVPWEIVEEMNRISLNDNTTDAEVVRLPIRTPPKSKLPGSTVPHINDSSPLDSSSSNGSSPNVPEHPIPISHSRGSSADNSSARDSVGENPLLAHSPLQVASSAEAKERPHSFSGGLSSADLRRLQQVGDTDHDRQLQQQQWAQSQYREGNVEQLSYPSLANRPLPQQPMFNYPPPTPQTQQRSDSEREDYNHQPQLRRNFNLGSVHAPGMNTAPPPPQYIQGRPNNANQAPINYRQNVRGFPAGPSPTGMVYPGNHHTSHLSLGNTQQLYEMMLPGPPPHDNHNPAVTRVQQQHNIFRATHHHSASDPSAIRDAATLALMQNFTPNMFQPGMPTMPLYPNQYYGQDLVVQQAIAARLQSQYSAPYNVAAAQNLPGETGSPTSSSGQTGPSANNRKLGLYKTELCRSWEEKGTCRYGTKCQFAHGEDELRTVSRHPKYKTEICKTFWVSGSCPYGKRCCFIHTELSSVAPGAPGAMENTPPPQADVRERSNSDPDTSASVSLLARISQRSQEPSGISTPVDSNNSFQFTRPPTGSLRVDTTVLDGASMKQNKSAYPSFASNGILLPAPEHITAKSPAPVTAGPDLGRHNLARMEIVGYPAKKATSTSSNGGNPRHSFNGSDDVNFSPSPPASNHSYTLASGENNQAGPTRNGHVRAGSAGNWGSISRSSHLSNTTYPNGASPAGEIMPNSPWSSTELAVGTSRLHEKAWA